MQTVLNANPATHIIFIAIKPSLARWALWPQMKAANARTQAYSESHSTLHFIDIATPMLGTDGQPRLELFVDDGLHLTAAGYDIWTNVLTSSLAKLH